MESVPETDTNSEPVPASASTSSSSVASTSASASSSSASTSSTGLSAAQLRQERIRRKVLANQGDRLKTVLGPSATDEDVQKLLKSQSTADEPESRSTSTTTHSHSEAFATTGFGNGPSTSELFAPARSSSQSDQVVTKPPPISVSTQRYIVCLVGALLSIIIPSVTTLGWNNFLTYFVLLELIIWGFVKGGSVTNASNSQVPIALTMFLVLISKPGLKDHIKFTYDLWCWLWIDFCCFVTSLFVVQISLAYIYT